MKDEVMDQISPEEVELFRHAKSLNSSVVAIHTKATDYGRDLGIALQLRGGQMVQVDTKGCKEDYGINLEHHIESSMQKYKEAIKIALDKLR